MSSLLKYLIAIASSLILAGTAQSDAVSTGFMEGHLKITWLGAAEAEASDEMPRQAVAPKTYAKYPLIVSSQDGKIEIARVTADGNGNYRAALPPGAYILDVEDRAAKRLRAKSQPFTVISNQTVRVDMNIVIGFAGTRP
jgi:uncharacterized membrane protein YdfJ with MMPL/SSD domain